MYKNSINRTYRNRSYRPGPRQYINRSMSDYPYTSRLYATEKAGTEIPALEIDYMTTNSTPVQTLAPLTIATNGTAAEIARLAALEQQIVAFNALYNLVPNRTNLYYLENKYREIVNLYPDVLDTERKRHLTIKVNAFQQKVRDAEAGLPTVTPTEPTVETGIIPGLPGTVKIGGYEISTKTLMYAAGAAGLLAFLSASKKGRRK